MWILQLAPILSKLGSDPSVLIVAMVTINLALADLGVKWGHGSFCTYCIDGADNLRFTLLDLVMILEAWRRLRVE